MSEATTPVLTTMATLWLSPGADVPDYGASRDRKVSAADAFRKLMSRFGEEQVRVEVTGFLASVCRAYDNGQTPDATDRSLSDCALALITGEGGLDAPDELVAHIVRSFPPVIWHFPVGQLISRYLGLTRLLEALLQGIESPPHGAALEDALTGFRLYLGQARPDEGARAQAPVVKRAFARIDELARSDDLEIARLAENARTALENRTAASS